MRNPLKSSGFWYGMTIVFTVRVFDVLWPRKPGPWWFYAVFAAAALVLMLRTEEP